MDPTLGEAERQQLQSEQGRDADNDAAEASPISQFCATC